MSKTAPTVKFGFMGFAGEKAEVGAAASRHRKFLYLWPGDAAFQAAIIPICKGCAVRWQIAPMNPVDKQPSASF